MRFRIKHGLSLCKYEIYCNELHYNILWVYNSTNRIDYNSAGYHSLIKAYKELLAHKMYFTKNSNHSAGLILFASFMFM